jgi:hypothetical protein
MDSGNHTAIILVLVLITAIVLVPLVLRFRRTRLTRDEFTIFKAKRFGKFELKAFLVRGDFNTTFEAYDTEKNKPVALRILDRKYVFVDSAVTQFFQKGELLKSLSDKFGSEHFVMDVRYGMVALNQEQRPYIVTDYVAGVSLAAVLDKVGKLSLSDSLAIIKQVGSCVSAAHGERVWFREFSPRNILLTIDGSKRLRVVVANIGIPFAKLPDEIYQEFKRGYYSPEEIEGKQVNELSDVYALAALFFRMLAGKEIGAGDDNKSIIEAGSLLSAALSPDPERRPRSIEKFIASVEVPSRKPTSAQGLHWERIIPKMEILARSSRVKLAGTDNVNRGKSAKRGTNQRKTWFDKFGYAFVQAGLTAFILWVGRKVEEWFSRPMKTVVLVAAAVAGIAASVWYFIILPESGKLTIRVNTFDAAMEPIDGASVTVRALDKSGQDVQIDLRHGDSEEGLGGITIKTGTDGKEVVNYRGRFKREEVIFFVEASFPDRYVKAEERVLLKGEKNVTSLYLRPMRNATIHVSHSDPMGLITPGFMPPQYVKYEFFAKNQYGDPLESARFWIGEDQVSSSGTGKALSARQQFQMSAGQEIRAQVEDSAMISIEIHPDPLSPTIIFASNPGEVIITEENQAKNVMSSIKLLQGADDETFTFVVLGEDDKPWEHGVEVFLNGKSLGSTDRNGKVTKKINDVDGFWSASPVVKLQLNSINKSWSLSRPFPLRKSTEREFPIRVLDVKPQ